MRPTTNDERLPAKTTYRPRKRTGDSGCVGARGSIHSLLLEGRKPPGHGGWVTDSVNIRETGGRQRDGETRIARSPASAGDRPREGAQPSRGHRREALGWISGLTGISVSDRIVSTGFGSPTQFRIKWSFGSRREETVPDRPGLRLRKRWNGSRLIGASASRGKGQFRINRGFGSRRDGTPRDTAGNCREPDRSG